MPVGANANARLMLGVPAQLRSSILSGMRWTLWLSVLAMPFSYGTNVLLARLGPEVIGTFGLLGVYIALVTAFFYLGGDTVALRFVPELPPGDRAPFLGSYFLVICLTLLPWLGFAALFPDKLHYLFGRQGGAPFHLLILCLSPIYILFCLLIAALKGMLEIRSAQALFRMVPIGSFLVYAGFFLGLRDILARHYTGLIWGIYLGLVTLGVTLGFRHLFGLCPGSYRTRWRFFLPRGFWRYTLSTQQVGVVWFFIQRMDYVLILNFGGLSVLGKYVAISTVAMLTPTVNTFFMDSLFPSLMNLVAAGNLDAASATLSVYMRILFAVNTITTCGLILLAGPLIALMGPKYADVRALVILMALLVGVASPGAFGGTLLASVGRQQRAVWVGVGQVGLFVALFLGLWPGWHLLGAVLACGISMLLSYVTLLAVAKQSVSIHFSVSRNHAKCALVSLLAAAAALMIHPLPLLFGLPLWLGTIGLFLWLAGYSRSECVELARCFVPALSDPLIVKSSQ